MEKQMKNIKDLCDKTEMPAEAAECVLKYSPLLDDTVIRGSMDKLFHPETWREGLSELKRHIGEDAGGFGILACELWCALKTFEVYEKYGISEEIYVDTMKCFSRFVREHRESCGCYGFDREWWTPRQISGLLFRIGELEYEMDTENERHIYLHIPSDARLSAERIEESIKAARKFFAEKFPDYAGAEIKCESWLLSPTLKELLPPASKILGFQDYFVTEPLGTDEEEFMTWVFKRRDIPLAEYPSS